MNNADLISVAWPIIKWAGGKVQIEETILADIDRLQPSTIDTYREPFLGGGAIFFALARRKRFRKAVLSDTNHELIGMYISVRDDVGGVIRELKKLLKKPYGEKTFYEIRAARPRSECARAARMIYLNKTCFAPGSQVLMEDETWRSVEAVVAGDRLWNGRVVQSTMARPYVGNVRRIRVQGSPFIMSVTDDHEILSVKGKGDQRQERRSLEHLSGEMNLRPARDLIVGDYVFLPTTGTRSDDMCWSDFWPDASEFGPQAVPRELGAVASGEICRLLGYYAAEGHIAYNYKNGVRGRIKSAVWTFNSSTVDTYVADLSDICVRLFGLAPVVTASSVEGKRCVSVELHSVYAAKFIQNLVQGQSWAEEQSARHTKRLHPALLTASLHLQVELLKGWLRGDGGLRHRVHSNSTELNGTCVVLSLARQLYRMAQRCGLKPLWRVSRPNGIELVNIGFSGAAVAALGFDVPPARSSDQRKFMNGYLLVRVREIVDLEYDAAVYNLDVDGDRLICVDGVISHNCFNGLYRVNKKGEFNVPWGKRKNPTILDEQGLRAASAALAGVGLVVSEFHPAAYLSTVTDFIYYDPPYVPVKTTSFVAYRAAGFRKDQQQVLAEHMAMLAAKGIPALLSNSHCPATLKLYKGLKKRKILTRHNINRNGSERGNVSELLVESRFTHRKKA